MVETFLKAKHWQLFLAMLGIPLTLQLFFMGSMVFSSSEGPVGSFHEITDLLFFPLMMFIFSSIYFGWMWSVGVGLQKMIPERLRFNTRKFKLFILFPFVYILLLMIFVSGSFFNLADSGFSPAIGMAIIFPLHLFAMFCMFYQLYFVAKTIKTAELQRKAHSGDYIGEFFLLWFYFIGIWIIQPRLNKLFKEHTAKLQNE